MHKKPRAGTKTQGEASPVLLGLSTQAVPLGWVGEPAASFPRRWRQGVPAQGAPLLSGFPFAFQEPRGAPEARWVQSRSPGPAARAPPSA